MSFSRGLCEIKVALSLGLTAPGPTCQNSYVNDACDVNDAGEDMYSSY